MNETGCDVLIVGAGITGLSIAHELVSRGMDNLIVIEKEDRPGRHASGRNSGVMHSGIYYAPGSLKARYCVEGNHLLKEFCKSNNIPIIQNGKVIIASNEQRLAGLYELKKRADHAGATSCIIDTEELKSLEPHAYSYEKALYCPETAVFRPLDVLHKITEILTVSGKVKFYYNTRFQSLISNKRIRCNDLIIKYDKFVNASGSYSEEIASSFGFKHNFRILPFKGTYKKLKRKSEYLVKSNLYPVPDLNQPFLGVHFTKNVDGEVYVGPTALPALSRENYGLFENLNRETVPIIARNAYMLFGNADFRSSAFRELKKYFDHYFWKESRKLIPEINKDDLLDSNKVGIRPQLVDWKSKELVMDFVILREKDSVHILNTISPGFTTSMSFAKHVVDSLLEK